MSYTLHFMIFTQKFGKVSGEGCAPCPGPFPNRHAISQVPPIHPDFGYATVTDVVKLVSIVCVFCGLGLRFLISLSTASRGVSLSSDLVIK